MLLEVYPFGEGPEAKMSHWPGWTWTTGFGFRPFLVITLHEAHPGQLAPQGDCQPTLMNSMSISAEMMSPRLVCKWPHGDQELCPLISSRHGLSWPAGVCGPSTWQLLIVNGYMKLWKVADFGTLKAWTKLLGREVFMMSQDSDELTLTRSPFS